MIHIATIHWKNDIWVDIQYKYLKRFTDEPFRIYSFLTDVNVDCKDMHYYSEKTHVTRHEYKLKKISDIILSEAKDEDYIMFLDGDAFPISSYLPNLKEKIESNQLVAVQRLENCGDRQPHPVFCMSTVGFWKSIKGDWDWGYEWKDHNGNWTTDIGGNLLGILEENKVDWHKLLRSNSVNWHPVYFAIYESMIYHHGCGFRSPLCQMDIEFYKNSFLFEKTLDAIINVIKSFWKVDRSPIRTTIQGQSIARKNQKLHKKVLDLIHSDDDFWKTFY